MEQRGRFARALSVALTVSMGLVGLTAIVETILWVGSWPGLGAAGEWQGIWMTWLGFLGAAYGVLHGLHLSVRWVADRLPGRWARAIGFIAESAVFGFALLLTVNAGRLVLTLENTLPATGLPAAAGYAPAVVGGALIAGVAVRRLVVGVRLGDGAGR